VIQSNDLVSTGANGRKEDSTSSQPRNQSALFIRDKDRLWIRSDCTSVSVAYLFGSTILGKKNRRSSTTRAWKRVQERTATCHPSIKDATSDDDDDNTQEPSPSSNPTDASFVGERSRASSIDSLLAQWTPGHPPRQGSW